MFLVGKEYYTECRTFRIRIRFKGGLRFVVGLSGCITYERVSYRYGLPNDECASYISTLNLRESDYGGECAQLERFTCRTNKMSSRYRTFDGSCNNPVRSSWGQALTGYKRLLHPRYADGIEEVRPVSSYK